MSFGFLITVPAQPSRKTALPAAPTGASQHRLTSRGTGFWKGRATVSEGQNQGFGSALAGGEREKGRVRREVSSPGVFGSCLFQPSPNPLL